MLNVSSDKDFVSLVKNVADIINEKGYFSHKTYRRHLGELSLVTTRIAVNQVVKHNIYYRNTLITYYQANRGNRQLDINVWIENTTLQAAKEDLMFIFFSESF